MPSTLQSPLSGTLKATRSVISSEDMRGGSEAQQTLIPQQLAAQAEQIRGLNEQFESLLSVQEQKNKEIEEFKDKFFEQSALLERRQKLAEELQRKKDAAEARAAGEQKIEGGLTRTMMKPVQKVKEQMGSILDKALGFFGWLFGGWLANQLLDMIKAWKTGDWDLMKKVNTTTKGVFAALSAGLTSINAALKGISKLILLILFFGFISISPKTRYVVGISLKQISSFLIWTVKYEDREKWIIDKPSWIPSQKKIKPSY